MKPLDTRAYIGLALYTVAVILLLLWVPVATVLAVFWLLTWGCQ